MKEYPIYKHLIQFSNMVDPEGNFIEGADAEYRAREENRRNEERSEERDTVKEGGDPEDEYYEGGD